MFASLPLFVWLLTTNLVLVGSNLVANVPNVAVMGDSSSVSMTQVNVQSDFCVRTNN
jgi:hypothetical protein